MSGGDMETRQVETWRMNEIRGRWERYRRDGLNGHHGPYDIATLGDYIDALTARLAAAERELALVCRYYVATDWEAFATRVLEEEGEPITFDAMMKQDLDVQAIIRRVLAYDATRPAPSATEPAAGEGVG